MNIETILEDTIVEYLDTEWTPSLTGVSIVTSFDDSEFQTPAVVVAVLDSEERQYGTPHRELYRRNMGNFTLQGFVDVRTHFGDHDKAQHEALAKGVRESFHCTGILGGLNDSTTGCHIYDFQLGRTQRGVEDESQRSTKFFFTCIAAAQDFA